MQPALPSPMDGYKISIKKKEIQSIKHMLLSSFLINKTLNFNVCDGHVLRDFTPIYFHSNLKNVRFT